MEYGDELVDQPFKRLISEKNWFRGSIRDFG
jgi:hypothetical protein